ncbi:MAG: DUF4392 domain-containing protein [Bacteroidales bacterium]|nr:DUF4392 domain-containing protein [Bacteroidales bacterium]
MTEDIVLQYDKRGMNLLATHLPLHYCTKAARELLQQKRGKVLIVTGFYAGGVGETDGPAGAYFLALALQRLNFSPIIVTDKYSFSYFADKQIKVVLFQENNIADLLHNCQAMISVERCGRAIDGQYYNMKKGNITAYTPPIDEFFVVGKDILQIGIGDGGNEIGMGNLKSVIERDLNIIPSCINCHHLIVATVSNWGAYGLINELGREVNMSLLPPCTDIEIFTNDIVKKGAKDGISCLSAPTIDGFPLNIECDIVDQLRNL